MLGVLAAVLDLDVQAPQSFLVPGALGDGDLFFEPSVPAGAATRADRCDRGLSESHVDTDALAFGIRLCVYVCVDAEIPASAGAFGKAPGTERICL